MMHEAVHLETKVDGMVCRAADEIVAFLNAEAVKNPVIDLFGTGFILLILTVPILFGLLSISIVCREIETRRAM